MSRSSLDSSSTGDEYVLVNADPKLRITGDIDDIHSEICSENQTNGRGRLSRSKMMGDNVSEKEIGNVIPSSLSVDVLNANNNGETGLYRKFPKFSDTRKLFCNLPKLQTKSPNHEVFSSEDANGIANSEDPDQTAPLGAV